MNQAVPMVLPRWSWQTFGPVLEPGSAVLGLLEPPIAVEETCLLCRRSRAHARIVGARLELDWRQQTVAQGCELWTTVLQGSFPLAQELLERFFTLLGLPVPRNLDGSASALRSALALEPELRAVSVEGFRQPFLLDGVQGDLFTLRVDGQPLEGLRLQHEDPSLLHQAVEGLDLSRRDSIDMPQAFKRALGLT